FGVALAVLQGYEHAQVGLAAAKLLSQQAHGLASLRSRDEPPEGSRFRRRSHYGFIVHPRGGPNLTDANARRWISHVDERAAGAFRPASRSRPGAGVEGLQLEPVEQGIDIHFAHDAAPVSLRCRPASPVTTTCAETSLVPPWA